MALVIEDGTGVTGANSYATLVEIRAYATARQYTVPAQDADLEALVLKAMMYLESKRREYKGTKTHGIGYLQWPRTDVQIDGYDLASDVIPEQLKDALAQLCFELQTVDPMKTTSGQVVRRERMDVFETEYAVNYKAERELPAYLPKVDALLEPLCNAFSALRVTRI